MPVPFAGQFAIMLVSQPRRFQKSPPGAEGKSAGTVRSRRMKFCEKGFGGWSHQQAKREISAQAVISRFSHLWPQMPCLQGSVS